MKAGLLKNRVTFQKLAQGKDELGGESEIVTNIIDKCWAKVEPISTKKVRVNGETITETLLFTILPNKRIDIDQQVLFENRIFTIRAIDKTQQDRMLITAEVDSRHDRY